MGKCCPNIPDRFSLFQQLFDTIRKYGLLISVMQEIDMESRPSRTLFWTLFENTLPWVTLALLAYLNLALFVGLPYAGANIFTNGKDWVVSDVFIHNSPLQPGDIVKQVGHVTAAEAQNDLTRGFFASARAGDLVEVRLERSGTPLVIQYTVPGLTPTELFGRLNGTWFIPYIFWLAGGVVLLFLRPRGVLRRLLAVFCFLNAVWLAAGSISNLHYGGTALILRSGVWLSLPVYLQLHWWFPSPLRRLPGWVWGGLYIVCAALAAASWLQFVPQNLYLVAFILAIVGSLVLLLVHVITQPGERRALRGMLVALGLVLLPVLVMLGLSLVQVQLVYAQVAVLGMVALPGFYFFTLYRRQLTPAQAQRSSRLVRTYFVVIVGGLLFCTVFAFLGRAQGVLMPATGLILGVTLMVVAVAAVSFIPFAVLPALADERITLNLGAGSFGFSANRVAPRFLFLFLQVLVGLTLAVLVQRLNFPGAEALSILLALVVVGLLGLLGYPPFERFFESRILGMTLAPEALLQSYAARITTSLELESLRALLLNEVLPSLLVRQFAQLEWRGTALAPLFALRVAPADLPATPAQPALEQAAGRFLPAAGVGLPAWMRLALPLRAAGELRGYWLLGRRDPDDYYSPADIAVLQALADQTALTLVNIEQAEALRALYFEDLERHEAERLHLAAELHDDVLNQMAVLNLNLQEASPAALAAYEQAVQRIREIVNGLRPAMLNFGLYLALETLVDELNERHPQGPRLVLGVPASVARYPARVELALFRVVQQACSNAIQHAQCRTIHIQGSLGEHAAALTVSDDGCGFDVTGLVNLPALLAGKHFGLAGMYERAALIGADLRFLSRTGQGTQVELNWQEK